MRNRQCQALKLLDDNGGWMPASEIAAAMDIPIEQVFLPLTQLTHGGDITSRNNPLPQYRISENGRRRAESLDESGAPGGGTTIVESRIVGSVGRTSLEERLVRLPDGQELVVAVVHRPAAVAVVPVRRSEHGEVKVLLVRQPRPAVGEKALLEIVAGKVEADEEPLETAKRELQEEAGLEGDVWDTLGGSPLLPSAGFLREPIHLFVACGLRAVASREEDGHITGEWIVLAEAIEMVLDGRICDMKAFAGLLAVDKILHRLPLA